MMWRDATGHFHARFDGTPRIVSLVPSLTELICDLGLAHCLVGRTGFCIHPAETVATIPKVGGTKDVNLEKIRRLAPTHVLLNIDENRKECCEALAQIVPHRIVTHPLTPHDNLDLYRMLGGIFGVEDKAAELCDALGLALANCKPKVEQTVLYCIWRDPWMTIARDTYISAMLTLIGWRTWPQESHGVRYPVFDWESVPLTAIDRILLSTEPYRFTAAHVEALAQQTGKPVQLVDGEMLSWYGSRAIAGVRYLDGL